MLYLFEEVSSFFCLSTFEGLNIHLREPPGRGGIFLRGSKTIVNVFCLIFVYFSWPGVLVGFGGLPRQERRLDRPGIRKMSTAKEISMLYY